MACLQCTESTANEVVMEVMDSARSILGHGMQNIMQTSCMMFERISKRRDLGSLWLTHDPDQGDTGNPTGYQTADGGDY